ncbi:MAG: 7-carboxy-7-deazaguanine synthase [Pseudomonadales bacterium]|nr:7-carboxy-7-deazaguanine synthase [Pseudomonadales bacterium]
MSYAVKEMFYTLQGEGANAGRPAVFCRFAGCNLWSGREQDRAGAVCRFCDTDFVGTDGPGGGRFADAASLAAAIAALWPATAARRARPLVVFTGGEPLLQLDQPAIDAVHALGMQVAVETNGTLAAPPGIDWLCVSPKSDAPLALTAGDELKLVYPQPEAPPERFAGLAFHEFYLQPMDGPAYAANLAATLDYCLRHPQWRLGLQLHKIVGIS